MSAFKDHFSNHAAIYSRHRPSYPPALFEYLASLCETRELAWDGACGNGQAALALTNCFEKVYASDPSEAQINQAFPHPKITYAVEKAEECSLAKQSVDLITIAQAIHWFDLDLFFSKASEVLKPNGMLAIIAYNLPKITTEVDIIIKEFHDHTVSEFWLPENNMLADEYRGIILPFQQISAPDFYIEKMLNLTDLLGLLNTWSAVQKYIKTYHTNPIDLIEKAILEAWNSPPENKKRVQWKIILKAGKFTT